MPSLKPGGGVGKRGAIRQRQVDTFGERRGEAGRGPASLPLNPLSRPVILV